MFAYSPPSASPPQIERVCDGSGGLDELLHLLAEKAAQSWVRFIFLRLSLGDSTYGAAPKVVLITWCGAASKLGERARSSVDRAMVKQWMNEWVSVSAEYPATTVDELTGTTSNRRPSIIVI
jgi:hypothetical protein